MILGVLAILLSAAIPLWPQSSTRASLATPAPKNWLRMYPLAPYSAHWHLKLRVSDVSRVLPMITAALEKNGGSATVPLDSAIADRPRGYQQLSYQISARSSSKTLAALKRLGKVEELRQTPESYPGLFEEARGKLERLRAEASANSEALSKAPSIAALVAELTEHLALVDRVHQESLDRILLNIEIEGGGASVSRP